MPYLSWLGINHYDEGPACRDEDLEELWYSKKSRSQNIGECSQLTEIVLSMFLYLFIWWWFPQGCHRRMVTRFAFADWPFRSFAFAVLIVCICRLAVPVVCICSSDRLHLQIGRSGRLHLQFRSFAFAVPNVINFFLWWFYRFKM